MSMLFKKHRYVNVPSGETSSGRLLSMLLFATMLPVLQNPNNLFHVVISAIEISLAIAAYHAAHTWGVRGGLRDILTKWCWCTPMDTCKRQSFTHWPSIRGKAPRELPCGMLYDPFSKTGRNIAPSKEYLDNSRMALIYSEIAASIPVIS